MTTSEATQFDATDEAFFNATDDDARVSEAPVTFDLEAQEPETEDNPAAAIASGRLRARRTRLTQAVVEIVTSLALISSMAVGMHLVRSSAAASARVAAASSSHARHVAPPSRPKPLALSVAFLPAGDL